MATFGCCEVYVASQIHCENWIRSFCGTQRGFGRHAMFRTAWYFTIPYYLKRTNNPEFPAIIPIAKTKKISLSFRRMFGYNQSRPERHAPASIESIQKYGSRASFKGCPLVCTKGPIHGMAPRIATIRTPPVKAASEGIDGVGGPPPCGRPTPAKRSSQTSVTNANQRIVPAICGSPRNVGVTPLTRAHR